MILSYETFEGWGEGIFIPDNSKSAQSENNKEW
jgi:hypothetical protein